MSANTELIDRETLEKIVADIKAILRRTSLDALNSVQWEFNQRYLFGNEADKPLIKAGKLFTKEGPVAKGAIWTSLDTGKLWMNTGAGWKNIGGLNNINKPDLIEIFHPRTDYPVEEPIVRTNVGGEFWIPYNFKKYEKYSLTKTQSPFTGFMTRTNNSRTDIAQDVRTSFSSGAGTYEFICMVDDAKYFCFTTGSSSNLVDITLTDLGSAIEPVKVTNMTETNRFVTFPIEKGKRYYYTKTARSFYIGYGKGSKSVQNPNNILKQVNNSGDSGAGTWSFVAEHDADWVYLYIGPDAVLESFELRSEDLPDYVLTYPYVTRSANDKPENPKVGDMIFDSYQAGTSGSPLWWNGTSWVDAMGNEVGTGPKTIAQAVTFTDNNADETITANDTAKIIVTASFGSTSILDFSDIEKAEGKIIEISNLSNNTITVKDEATTTALTDCNGSIVRAVCLSDVWHFYKVSGITEIVNQS